MVFTANISKWRQTMIEKKVIFQETGSQALNPQNKIDSHNLPFTLNSSIGCHFGCQYCFIQGFPFRLHAVFGEEVKVKLWIAEQLDKELHKYRDLPQYVKRVQVNVSTEGYLPAAMIRTRKQYDRDIMKEILDVFKKHWDEGNRWMVHLLTKSHMIRKHIDIIRNMRDQVQLELTITTLDEERKKLLEGLAPSVRKRLNIIQEFSEAGIFVRVMCMPLIGPREEGAELREVCLGRGARAFKHKGVNYWDENGLLEGEAVRTRGREDEVYEDLLLKSSEPVIENGQPRTMTIPMPVIIRSGEKGKRWNSFDLNDFEIKEVVMENSGYADMNDIDWGYVV
jgi:DNA repair photolyase